MSALDQFLSHLSDLEKKATPGKWDSIENPMREDGKFLRNSLGKGIALFQINPKDSDFIAASRSAIPLLIKIVRIANTSFEIILDSNQADTPLPAKIAIQTLKQIEELIAKENVK